MRCIAVLLVFTISPAFAQSVLEPTKLPFSERFTEHVPVSGRTLVGLISTSGPHPPTGTGLATGSIALPSTLPANTVVCVRATTQDGRYSAENSYMAQNPAVDASATLAWPTAYKHVLGEVKLQEIAAVVRRGSCADSNEVVPALLGAHGDAGYFQVLVNTRGSTVTAALRDLETGKTIYRANCVRVEGGSRVAFDARCVLGPVADLPARVSLRLEQVSRDGLQTEVLEAVSLRTAS